MTLTRHNHRLRGVGFTVVELLVAVSIMTLIVLVLFGMFDQTQKALRGNTAQVDVLEGGRAAMELMTRELEQMEASKLAGCTNFWVGVTWPPWRLPLVRTNAYRTNVLEEFFFVTPFNKLWSGIGYKVLTTNGVGTLYRFGSSRHVSLFTSNVLTEDWILLANTNYPQVFQRVTDGIVHIRLTAFDTNGYAFSYTNNYNNPNLTVTNAPFNGTPTGENGYVFREGAVPSYVDLEMGILEPQVLERYKSMLVNPGLATNFLRKQAGAVHLFQQRIPIRTAQ